MRRRAIFTLLILLLAIAAGAFTAARKLTAMIETRSELALSGAMEQAGLDWVRVRTDGLRVILTGTAPGEAARFDAVATAGARVAASRIEDRIRIGEPTVARAPDYALEILRDGPRITLSGLMPADGTRGRIALALRRIGPGLALTDAADIRPGDVPQGWGEALDLALRAVLALPRAQVGIEGCRVSATGMAEGAAEARALRTAFAARQPACVGRVELLAPRPVVSPYVFELDWDGGAPRLLRCTAQTGEEIARIGHALDTLGTLADDAGPVTPAAGIDCTEALGAPSEDWGQAVIAGLGALGRLGGGHLLLSDTEIALEAPADVGAERLEQVRAAYADTLPGMFSLSARLGPADPGRDLALVDLPEAVFEASRDPDGGLRLSGPIPNESGRLALSTYAAALFGTEAVEPHVMIDPTLPDGWSGRVMAGLRALSLLEAGHLRVTESSLSLTGSSVLESIERDSRAILREVTGPETRLDLDVSFDAEAVAPPPLPRPAACLADMNALLADEQVQFAPGSTEISEDSRDVIASLGAILSACGPARFEIGGYTDNSGAAEMNLTLSEQRAEAVLDALIELGVPLAKLASKGYGEADPIADNGTEEGRAANRRIGLRILEVDDGL